MRELAEIYLQLLLKALELSLYLFALMGLIRMMEMRSESEFWHRHGELLQLIAVIVFALAIIALIVVNL